MSPVLVAAVWILVTLDCALIGYRLAMGRSGRLNKRRQYQLATIRAGAFGQPALAAVTMVAVVAVDRGGPGEAASFDRAMARFLAVGGCYAAVILATSALCAFRSVTLRSASSVLVFGPLTLLRPVVVVLTVAVAIGPHPSGALVFVGLLIMIPGVALEPVLDRRLAARVMAAAVNDPEAVVAMSPAVGGD